MKPSPKELAAGRKACDCLDAFQRQRPFQSLLFVLLVAAAGFHHAFQKGGWKVALAVASFWTLIGAVDFYRYDKQKQKAREAEALLSQLKAAYGDIFYSEIERVPHSLFYNLFIRRYPPFNRPTVKLP